MLNKKIKEKLISVLSHMQNKRFYSPLEIEQAFDSINISIAGESVTSVEFINNILSQQNIPFVLLYMYDHDRSEKYLTVWDNDWTDEP